MATVVSTAKEASRTALVSLMSQYTRPSRDSAALIPYIVGPPGISKTALTEQFAKDLGIKRLVVISCGVIDPNLEFIGLPEVFKVSKENGGFVVETTIDYDEKGRKKKSKVMEDSETFITKWTKPERLRAFDDLAPDERGLLIFDDVQFLPGHMQAMLMQLATGGMRIHEHDIGKDRNVAVMLLGNGLGDFAGAEDLLAPVIGRIHLIEVDALNHKEQVTNDYLEWATTDGNVHPAITTYLKKSPSDILTAKADLEAERETEPFASPRSLVNLALCLDIIKEMSKGSSSFILSTIFKDADPQKIDQIFSETRKYLKGRLVQFASGIIGPRAAEKLRPTFSDFFDARFSLDKALKSDSENFGLYIAADEFADQLTDLAINKALGKRVPLSEKVLEEWKTGKSSEEISRALLEEKRLEQKERFKEEAKSKLKNLMKRTKTLKKTAKGKTPEENSTQEEPLEPDRVFEDALAAEENFRGSPKTTAADKDGSKFLAPPPKLSQAETRTLKFLDSITKNLAIDQVPSTKKAFLSKFFKIARGRLLRKLTLVDSLTTAWNFREDDTPVRVLEALEIRHTGAQKKARKAQVAKQRKKKTLKKS